MVRDVSNAMALAIFFFLGASGCATKATALGDETHFQTCEMDDDCANAGPAYRCQSGFCRAPMGDGSVLDLASNDPKLRFSDASSFNVPFIDPSPDAGTVCEFGHDVCDGVDSSVVIQGDAGIERLIYPMDSGCGMCNGERCELWGYGVTGCGSVGVILAACAGSDGKPPCVDTVQKKYIDENGQVWNALLAGSSAQITESDYSSSVVDVDLTLTITRGTTTREYGVHAHFCGDLRSTLIACN